MSWLYPRRITITRPKGQTDVGAVQYGGLSPREESVVASDVPAAIQLRTSGSSPLGQLPADATSRTFWKVLIPMGELDEGVVQTNDIVIDDLSSRYKVIGPYFTMLGYNLLTERLEV